jgi:NTE family protein
MKDKQKLTDIYIKPEVSDYGVISFNEGQEIVKKGEEATFGVYQQLKKLADTTIVYKLNEVKVKKDFLQVKSISINKLDNYTRAYVLGKLRFNNGK